MNTNHSNELSRRDFIARTAGVAAGTLALNGGALTCFGAGKFSPPIAVFSKVYQQLKLNFEDAAEVTAEAGLDGIDCPARPGGEVLPERVLEDLTRYAAALRKHDRRIHLLTSAITRVDSPHAENILRTAKRLKIQYCRLGFLDRQTDAVAAEKQISEVKAQLKDVAALNRQIGVCGLLQNHSPGGERAYLGGDLDDMHALVKDFDPAEIGVAFDIGHALVVHGDAWAAHFEKLKSHIRVAYIKDAKREKRFVPFGEGEIKRTDFFKRLRQMNYRAPISMHIEFDWADKDGKKTRAGLVKALSGSLKVLKQWLAEA